MKIGLAWGGTKRSIPGQRIETSALARIVGVEAAKKIALHVNHGHRTGSSIRLDIPTVRNVENRPLKEQILATTGTTRQIALALQCSERYVRMVRRAVDG